MQEFLQAIIDAHGGLERWSRLSSAELDLNFSGIVLEMKGFPRHLRPHCAIDLRSQRVVIQGIGAPDELCVYTPDRVWSERPDGTVTAALDAPREALKQVPREEPWHPLHLTYFIGYALRNYLTVPFTFAEPGMRFRDLGTHAEAGETWRKLEVSYPGDIPVHTATQTLYFGPDHLLRRLDYSVDVLGGGPANHYCYDYRSFDGIMVPIVRRVVSPVDMGPLRAGRTTIFLLDYVDLVFHGTKG